jgi:hypothetical protein
LSRNVAHVPVSAGRQCRLYGSAFRGFVAAAGSFVPCGNGRDISGEE